jgi:hypothetical protein
VRVAVRVGVGVTVGASAMPVVGLADGCGGPVLVAGATMGADVAGSDGVGLGAARTSSGVAEAGTVVGTASPCTAVGVAGG